MSHPEMGSKAPEWSARVEIPADIDGVRTALSDLSGVVSARRWHQAAIVYAYTRDGEPGERVDITSSELTTGLTPREFAELAIRGLNSDQTVRRYRRTWAAAMELGACGEATPGSTVDLPDLDWDEMFRENAGGAHVGHNAGDSEWYSPPALVEAARRVMGSIDLDPCSTADANEVIKAATFYTVEENGLSLPWSGNVWLNPPYSHPEVVDFTSKLTEAHGSGAVPMAVALTNNSTDTPWWQELARWSQGVCFPEGRVKFWHPDKKSSPLQGQSLLFIGPEDVAGKFSAEFSAFGITW